MSMTREEAIKMLTAKVECMLREISGSDEECNSHRCGECNLCYEQGDMGEQVEYLQMAIKALAEPQWIPCSEQLPNTNGIYIVARRISDGFEYRNITNACYFDGSNTWHDDTRINHERKYLADVLAWRPMPEPWEGDTE